LGETEDGRIRRMIRTKSDLKEYLEKDKRALNIKKTRPNLYGDEIWKFEIALRKDEFYQNSNSNKLIGLFWKWRHRALGLKLGFSIPCNCFGGGGLRINHYGLIVVHPSARIGEWCDIHQGVNIGQNLEKGTVPKLGSNVWIGPGAKLFGAIKLGDNMMIGANSVVTKSFPEGNCTIAGSPAKVIKNTGNVWYRE